MKLHHVKKVVCAIGLLMVGLVGVPAFAHEDRTPTGSWEGVAQSTTIPLFPLTTLLTFGADGNSCRVTPTLSPAGTSGHGDGAVPRMTDLRLRSCCSTKALLITLLHRAL